MSELRRARAQDAPALADLFWASRQANAPAIPLPVHPRSSVEPFLRHLVAEREVWVAVDDGDEPAALLVLGDDELEHLYVAVGRTGAGLGSRLVGLARERRPEGLALHVFETNTGAVRFYRRHGFEVVGGSDGDNEEGAPDLRMRWAPGQRR